MPRGKQVNLQHTLTLVSFFYFTYSASKACLLPFLSLYLRQLGLSATQTGVIYSLKAFVALWAAPLWSTCATQYGRQRVVLMVAIFMMIASNLGLTLLPPADDKLYFAFCTEDNSNLLNGSGVHGNNDAGSDANFMHASLAATSQPVPSGNHLSTPSEPIISFHTQSAQHLPTESNLIDIKTTTLKPLTTGHLQTSNKQLTQQFTPPKKHHPKPAHVTSSSAKTPSVHSPKPNGHKGTGFHKPMTKPNKVPSKETSKNPGKPTHTDSSAELRYHTDHLYDNGLISDSKWNGVTQGPKSNSWKSSQEKNVKPHVTESEKHGPSKTEKTGTVEKYPSKGTQKPFHEDTSGSYVESHQIVKTGSTLNWGDILEQDSLTKDYKKQPSSRQKIHTSTVNLKEKTSPYNHQNREGYKHLVKRSSPTDPDKISREDKMPRSLGSGLDSLSKTVASFLEFQQILFVLALLIMVIGEILSCPVDKICDSSLYESLDAIDELDKYRRHYVPSVIGYGLFALVVTLIVDNTNCQIFLDASHFMIHFYLFACLLGLAFLLAFFYPIPAPKKGSRKLRFWKGLKLLLCDPHNAIITLTMVVTGALASNIQIFLFWHIQDLGGKEVVMGVAVFVAVISHIPMLFATGWLTKKLSQTGVLVLALLSLALRLLYFTFLWTPWAVVPVECLCAFSQQALWQTVYSYGEQISPPAMERSIKSILNSFYHGLGFAIGSAVGGVVFDQGGLRVLYGSSAVLGLVWAVVVAVVARLVPKKKKLHYSSLLLREEEGEEGYLSDEDSDEVSGNDWLVKALKDDF